ncbi:HD-GYP domain-containing protein [Paenibacillus graminis]|uniref:HD family phosphohydrolase n=1 Tax=Paenibacillus graminis TaxID=189425 RepID=A0A089MGP8_9BACL|nr:HD domain-containing phosphohydrolase [Paenibacillus graminis]AIQ70678.1 HD family phosphohydrolase [Paenibacillus graminis]MEC0169759.1 HD domain-containing protein [Paenibacillus graminis]
MRIHIKKLKIGDVLKNDIFNRQGLHVLAKKTKIRLEDIELLNKHSIKFVDVEGNVEDRIAREVFNGTERPLRVKPNYDKSLREYQAFFLEAVISGEFDRSKMEWTLMPLLEQLDEQKDVLTLLFSFQKEDETIYNHSLQVGLLSYYIAEWLGYPKSERFEISKAGYLHDIGKSRVRLSIRNRVGQLNDEEEKELQKHTAAGYQIICKSLKDNTTALVALQHHEREDGTGYPLGLQKDKIHPYAQIVAVANEFISKTFVSAEQPRRNFSIVLQEIYELGFGKLNEKPVQALIHNILPNMIGKKVLLSNGDIGEIILNNPMDFFRPLVKVKEAFIDLSKERSLNIQEIIV